MKNVKTRFAPSPTGFLHVGGIRTALFAWLVAKQNDGEFILRLEDTDKKREVKGAGEHIVTSLESLGIRIDKGPIKQSERLDLYIQWADKLIRAGRAYADPYSQAEVEGFRQAAKDQKIPFLYRDYRPDNPPKWDGSTPLRFKSDPKNYSWKDEVMGNISTGPEVIDDFVLIKSDGYPTYNFAHIVDDADMEITHVIRGQEFLASVPNYLNLYEALEIKPPIMATMPHIMGPDGKKKLSKRDGAKDVLDYLREGYLPEAMVSFIATLGWNDGTTQEVFTTKELIKKFSLDRVQKSGARFDEQRLAWVNGHFIREMNIDELYKLAEGYWPKSSAKFDNKYKKNVLKLVQERLKYLNELGELTEFFFKDLPISPELITTHKQLKKCERINLSQMLEKTLKMLEGSNFTPEDLQDKLNQLLEQTGQKPAVLFSLIRIATTQAPSSPGLADTMAVLGKETTLKRIKSQLGSLS